MLAVAGLLLGLVAFASPVAHAQYISSCGFVLDPPVIDIGGQIHIIGAGFTPGGTVTFYISGPSGKQVLGTAQVNNDPDGGVDALFNIPASFNTDGEYEITATCPDGQLASNTIIVGQGFVTTTTPTALPVTGASHTAGFVRLAAILIALGGLILVATAGRRRAAAAS
jgi:hypothetical protein